MSNNTLPKLVVKAVGVVFAAGVIALNQARPGQAAELTFDFLSTETTYYADFPNQRTTSTRTGSYTVDANAFDTALSNPSPSTVSVISYTIDGVVPPSSGGTLDFAFGGGKPFNVFLTPVFAPYVSDNLASPGFSRVTTTPPPGSSLACGQITCGSTLDRIDTTSLLVTENAYRQTPVPEPSEISGILFFSVGLLLIRKKSSFKKRVVSQKSGEVAS